MISEESIQLVKHAAACGGDACGNGDQAQALAQNGNMEGAIERLTWMLDNLKAAHSSARLALLALEAEREGGA